MRKGDKVKVKGGYSDMGVGPNDIGVVISQDKYKIPDGTGSINPRRGWDVEVKFDHKIGTCIFQGEELEVVEKFVPKKAKMTLRKSIVIVDEKHAILMTRDDFKEFNAAASCCDIAAAARTYSDKEILQFMREHIIIYYDGKKWGFNDTEIRESICLLLEKAVA